MITDDELDTVIGLLPKMINKMAEHHIFASMAEANFAYFQELKLAGFTADQAMDIVKNSKPFESFNR